jgi:hypothetical protein
MPLMPHGRRTPQIRWNLVVTRAEMMPPLMPQLRLMPPLIPRESSLIERRVATVATVATDL